MAGPLICLYKQINRRPSHDQHPGQPNAPYPCTMDISIVIPLLNEHESLPHLVGQLHGVLGGMGRSYEIILVDDGSNDGSWDEIRRLSAADARVKGIRF